MTCIVGLAQGGRVYLGGDSAGVSGWSLMLRADEKVFVRHGEAPMVFGFTSSFRMGQLLRYRLQLDGTPPLKTVTDDRLSEWMATVFVDAVRKCLRDGGFATRLNEVETGGTFLVGVRGRLFCVDSDYQVAEPVDPFAACGCGNDVALGAMFATQGTNLAAEDRISLALRAAEHHSAGVRGPFVIQSIEPWESPANAGVIQRLAD